MARGEKKKVKGVSGGGSVLGFGVSFGSSWEIDASERKAARQLLTFIEDRRVLFNPVDLEDQRHAEASITEIRGRCTDVISQVDDEASVGHAARAIREACRRFFDIDRVRCVVGHRNATSSLPLASCAEGLGSTSWPSPTTTK